MKRIVSIAIAFALLGSSAALALPGERCTVKAVKPAASYLASDGASGMERGDRMVVTMVRHDRKTNAITLCGAGAGCYDAAALEFTTPCRVSSKPDTDSTTDDELDYLAK